MPNDGKYLEKVIQLIEKSISPNDSVEHDIEMPILSSREGYTTQCDIVIRKGKVPRQTITIVEVQDRNSKVKPNDFRGWEQKLSDVGAQHLIAVSRQDFPSSIKEKAALSGNKVFLMNIKNVMPESIPDFVGFKFYDLKFNITKMHSINPVFSRSTAKSLGIEKDDIYKKDQTNNQEKIWSLDGKSTLSFNEICYMHHKCSLGSHQGRNTIEYNLHKNEIFYMFINNTFLPISIKCDYDWTCSINEFPVSILSYEQVEEGTLAWLAEINYNGVNGKTVIKVPIIKVDNGYLVNMMSIDSQEDSTITLSVMRKSDSTNI